MSRTNLVFELEAEKARMMVWMAICLHNARKEAKMSVKTLASRMEMPIKLVQDMEEGQEDISWETFLKFGLILGVHWMVGPLELLPEVKKEMREKFR